jgi:hypothetical protein
MLRGVGVDGLELATVNARVRLAVAVEVVTTSHDRPRYRRLEDRRDDVLSLPEDSLRPADGDRFDDHENLTGSWCCLTPTRSNDKRARRAGRGVISREHVSKRGWIAAPVGGL